MQFPDILVHSWCDVKRNVDVDIFSSFSLQNQGSHLYVRQPLWFLIS